MIPVLTYQPCLTLRNGCFISDDNHSGCGWSESFIITISGFINDLWLIDRVETQVWYIFHILLLFFFIVCNAFEFKICCVETCLGPSLKHCSQVTVQMCCYLDCQVLVLLVDVKSEAYSNCFFTVGSYLQNTV